MKKYSAVRGVAAALLMLGAAVAAPAQALEPFKTEAELVPFTEGVMKLVAAGDLNAAYATIKPRTTLSAAEVDKSAQQAVGSRNAEFVQRYGRTRGHEFVSRKKVGVSLVRVSFLEKTDLHPIVWNFYYYLTPTGWVIDSFTWDNQVAAVFLRN